MLQNLQVELAEAILTHSNDTALVSHPARLSIYHHHIMTTLTNALRQTYPLIVKLVGFDFFYLAAKDYILNYPSRNSTLHEYGEYFSDFLADYAPVKNLVYLSEVADFEWKCRQIYFAPDHAPLDVNTLYTIARENYDRLHFSMHPASMLMKCYFPLLKIVELCQEPDAQEVNLNEKGVNLLIFRKELDIILSDLPQADFFFLQACSQHRSLSEAFATALQYDANFSLEVKLTEFINEKILIDFQFIS